MRPSSRSAPHPRAASTGRPRTPTAARCRAPRPAGRCRSRTTVRRRARSRRTAGSPTSGGRAPRRAARRPSPASALTAVAVASGAVEQRRVGPRRCRRRRLGDSAWRTRGPATNAAHDRDRSGGSGRASHEVADCATVTGRPRLTRQDRPRHGGQHARRREHQLAVADQVGQRGDQQVVEAARAGRAARHRIASAKTAGSSAAAMSRSGSKTSDQLVEGSPRAEIDDRGVVGGDHERRQRVVRSPRGPPVPVPAPSRSWTVARAWPGRRTPPTPGCCQARSRTRCRSSA